MLAIDTNDFDAYYFRALTKFNLSDYNGALIDYNRCIQLSYRYIENFIPFTIHSQEEFNFIQISNQIKRVNKINPNFAQMYLSRGLAKKELEDKIGAEYDWLKAKKLKNKQAKKYIKMYIKTKN